MSRARVNILGAGLCGSLLAIMLARRGVPATLHERRPDPRNDPGDGGRSINLALAARGIRALRHAGVFERVEPLILPMVGRCIHSLTGETELQPYGQQRHEVIYSVSRAGLNRVLVQAAEEQGVTLRFDLPAAEFDRQTAQVRLANGETVGGAPLIAADGAGSMVRRAYGDGAPIFASEQMLPHGYKELTIPPSPNGDFRMRSDALHIWPRGGFMLIALPNPGGDFTLTLFLAHTGTPSFGSLRTSDDVDAFFDEHFPDVVELIPSLADTFLKNPTGELGTVRCKGWHLGDKALLIGDAAHAIVPFHGQGMNAGFEDCRVLDELMQSSAADTEALFRDFERARIDNANAIADMALENYVEMRDSVNDPAFRMQKALSFELERRFPNRFIPRYSMVMFHDEIEYAEALARGAAQQELLQQLTAGASGIDEVDLALADKLIKERLCPL